MQNCDLSLSDQQLQDYRRAIDTLIDKGLDLQDKLIKFRIETLKDFLLELGSLFKALKEALPSQLSIPLQIQLSQIFPARAHPQPPDPKPKTLIAPVIMCRQPWNQVESSSEQPKCY